MILYDAWNNFHNFNLAQFYMEQMLNEIYLSLILNYDSLCLQIFFFFWENWDNTVDSNQLFAIKFKLKNIHVTWLLII